MNDETDAGREDPEGARRHARTHARRVKDPPHHLRCDWMRGGDRCLKGSGHPGAHACTDEELSQAPA